MLDLTILNQNYFEIKMLDGSILNLKKLTQKMLLKTTFLDKEIEKANKNKEFEKILNLNVDRLHLILNNNKEGKVITKEEIEEFNAEIITAIIVAYSNWMQEFNSNPN